MPRSRAWWTVATRSSTTDRLRLVPEVPAGQVRRWPAGPRERARGDGDRLSSAWSKSTSATVHLVGDAVDAEEVEETERVALIRNGDAAVFRQLVEELHAPLVRMARLYVPPALAEEVVQETWIAVILGIDRFEGRSSLRSWTYRIMLNKVRTLARREARIIPFATAQSSRLGDAPAVDPSRLENPELGPGYWPAAPPSWERPDLEALRGELADLLASCIDRLPAAQREVVVLRDVEGWTSDEVCDALGLTSVNQRVLLHRARTRLRSFLEEYLDER